MKTIFGVNYYTVKEVSSMLGISEVSLRRFIKKGELGATRIGLPFYSTEEDIQNFLKTHKTGSGE